MAQVVLITGFVSINGVDLSDHCKSVKVSYSADSLENSAMGSLAHTHIPGALNISIEGVLYQDYASGKTNETIFPLIGSQTLFPFIVKGVSAAGTNNTFTGANFMFDGAYEPVSGAWNALEETPFKLIPGAGYTFVKT